MVQSTNDILKSQLQNSGWMGGNPTPKSIFGKQTALSRRAVGLRIGVYLHGGSMERNSISGIGQRGEADRRSRVLQLALNTL